MGAKIEAIECVFPDKLVSNAELGKEFVGYDYSKFENKVGIKSRYVVDDETTSLDLGVKAAEKLFSRGFEKDAIDYVLFCTQSPDYILPTSACIIQDKLGLQKNIGAFDFNLGCSGYTYGLSMAKALINSKQAKNILLITAETYSKFLNKKDKSNRFIFGDAATCTLIVESDEEQIGEFCFGTDGSGYDKLIIRNGASRHKYQPNCTLKEYGSDNMYTDNELYMDGPEIFNFTSSIIPKFTKSVLEKNNISNESVSQYIFHQANAFMLDFMRKRMKVEENKFYINLEETGNTVSNTIPIALKEYSGAINRHEKIVLVGFGVGLSWSGGLITINKSL
jgi:3-oxoacyl-[acyl-carrier-protein] synthase-3